MELRNRHAVPTKPASALTQFAEHVERDRGETERHMPASSTPLLFGTKFTNAMHAGRGV